MRPSHVIGLVAACGLAACGGDSTPPTPPTQTTLVTSGSAEGSGNFEGPMDAVSSPDGSTFFFSAHQTDAPADAESTAAIYKVAASGGNAEILTSGGQLEDPSGLLMSCDGSTLYIADLSYQHEDAELELEEDDDSDKSALYTLDLATNDLTPLTHTNIGEAAGLAFDSECKTLYVSGYTAAGVPALFTLSPEGGAASVVAQGQPLESPSGVYVDVDHVAWVMDHQPSVQLGGALFAIQPDGTASVVVDGLTISEPAGVSLVSKGDIAVIPSRDVDGNSQLFTVSTSTGESTIVAAPEMSEPAGIRTATQASVMVVVDTDGDAIYSAQ